jgi:hypothetical protein
MLVLMTIGVLLLAIVTMQLASIGRGLGREIRRALLLLEEIRDLLGGQRQSQRLHSPMWADAYDRDRQQSQPEPDKK